MSEKHGLLSGKIAPGWAAIYVSGEDDHTTGIGWLESRMYPDRNRLDQAFDRVREQLRATPVV